MFYDPSQFEFASALRAGWKEIRREYRSVAADLTEWVERDLYDGSWAVFQLFGFPDGERVESNYRRCPYAAALVERHVAHHGVAGFSRLSAGSSIESHRGYQGDYLRCHVGLEVPAGDCALFSDGEIRRWQPGELLVFDDRVEHEAWNRTGDDRVVFLVDFVPPT